MKIQLWSSNYDPEPTGIAPVCTTWAQAMAARGHEVDVVSAHPYYPEPRWGTRLLPYREVRDGIPLVRLPILAGRKGLFRRIAEQLSFLGWLALATPFLGLGKRDVVISVTPSFPALLVAMLATRAKGVPWVIWIHDILPDGAASTGYLKKKGPLFRLARALEDAAYRNADVIFVLSRTFRDNLLAKGVPAGKIRIAYNPATTEIGSTYMKGAAPNSAPRVLWMGNIGRSQGLPEIVRAFEADPDLEAQGVRLIVTGTGVSMPEVEQAVTSDRVELLGLVSTEELRAELSRARVGAVTQSYDGGEFNVPSKLMNYLAVGLPVIASVDPNGEIRKLVEDSEGGWVTDCKDPGEFAAAAARALREEERLAERSRSAEDFARENLSPDAHARTFEEGLEELLG